MQISRSARKKSLISLTPLIDVVFLLLVFFMLASTFARYGGFDLSGGQSGAVRGANVSNLIVLRLLGSGHIEINGDRIALDELADRLRALKKSNGLRVAIKPLAGANVQDVVDVVERIRFNGVREVIVVK